MLQTNLKGPLTLAGIVIGLSLLLGLGGSYFLASALDAKAQAVSAARVAAARASTLGPRLAALEDQEAIAAGYERVIALLMPNQEQLLEVPRNIEQLARSHGTSASFQFLGSPAAGEAKPGDSLPFSLVVSGAPEALMAFLQNLEVRNPRYTLSVSTAELELAGQEGGGRLSVTGSFYYQ